MSKSEVEGLLDRLEAAEAKVARVEALADEWANTERSIGCLNAAHRLRSALGEQVNMPEETQQQICDRCKQSFEPRNGDYVTMCETCDHEIADAMVTANKVLEGELGRKDMTFVQFRQAMIDEHPKYLTDHDIHTIWVDLTEGPAQTEAVNHAIDQAMAWVDREKTSRYFKTVISKATEPEDLFGPMVMPAPSMRERLSNLLSRMRA